MIALRPESRLAALLATLAGLAFAVGAPSPAAAATDGAACAPSPTRVASRPVPGDVALTPLLMHVPNAPVPVIGSDGDCHLVYELALTNFAGGRATLARLDVLDASGTVVAALDVASIAKRLVVRDRMATPGTLGAAQSGILYLHVRIPATTRVPGALAHRLSLVLNGQPLVETAGGVDVAPAADLVLDPPLRGARYIAGDGCCDSTRHVRATLPVNGAMYTAQRFAIDWEQLDEQGRIYVGDPKKPESYVIYGRPVHAVADARVIAAVDRLPDSPPGALPANIPLEDADGNHVVLDLGDGRFALCAHLAPGSVAVRMGERVRRGDVLGRVGTSGNSSEPHLHFQVTDGPSTFASNGLPYLLSRFVARAQGASTAAFDRATVDGGPVARKPVAGSNALERVLPLDLLIVDFR